MFKSVQKSIFIGYGITHVNTELVGSASVMLGVIGNDDFGEVLCGLV